MSTSGTGTTVPNPAPNKPPARSSWTVVPVPSCTSPDRLIGDFFVDQSDA